MEPSTSPRSEEIYRAAVGEAKADYYVPKFLRFDEPGAARTSWNWPAFFITFFWLLYRRMYGYAFLYLLPLPIALALSSLIVTALFGQTVGAIVYWVVMIVVQYVVIPTYANAIYHSHIRKRIATLESSAPSQDALVQRLIGYSAVSGAGAIIGIACFVGVAVIGILAAIAIPAYQDYTIRAQVSEGLTLAAPVKASVADSYLSSTVWPADLEAAGSSCS